MAEHTTRVLMLGDIVGSAGRAIFQKHIQSLMREYKANALVVNGENSANGRGITSRIANFFKHNGVNCITTGNHIWHHKEIYEYLRTHNFVLRPENYPTDCPGTGVMTFTLPEGITIGVLNLQGRVFMRDNLACPFKTADSALTFLRSKTNIILVDMHAEATSEKMGIGFYLDGRVSAIVGTHTHIQTADERILPLGTAYITDLGMAGALNSMIGMKKGPIIQHFLTQMPTKFLVETEGPMILCGVCIEIDKETGKAIYIQRIRIQDVDINIDNND